MVQKNIKGLVFGTVIGTMLGSLSAALMPNKEGLLANKKRFADKAKSFSDNFYNGLKSLSEGRRENHTANFVKGALSGMLLGAGMAAFLTPKTGKQLRNNLSRGYQDLADKTQEVLHAINTQEKRIFPSAKRRTAHAAFKKRRSQARTTNKRHRATAAKR
jgi:gas vesicle protein